MLVDLLVEGKLAMIFGEDKEVESKVEKLLDAGAKVTVVNENFTAGIKRFGPSSSLQRLQAEPSRWKELLAIKRPRIAVIATGDEALDRSLAEAARSTGALVCVVDKPSLNDFNTPAVAKIGDVRVAISTGGLSPTMASSLRKRIERLIKPEDVMQVRLQGHVRRLAKESIPDKQNRGRLIHAVMRDKVIRRLLSRIASERRRSELREWSGLHERRVNE